MKLTERSKIHEHILVWIINSYDHVINLVRYPVPWKTLTGNKMLSLHSSWYKYLPAIYGFIISNILKPGPCDIDLYIYTLHVRILALA